MTKNRKFIEKCFKDSKGNITLGEKPNLPLIIFLVCLFLQSISEGKLYTIVDLIGFGAIFTWAWLEIFQGTNYFRRFLGLLVMLITLYSRLY
jgi:hypothetical protein